MCWLQQSAQLWHYPTFLLVPLMVVAGIECLAGCHAWRLLLGLNGAVLGFVAGAFVTVWLGSPLLILFVALGGAAAGIALFASIAPLGSFVLAFGSAASWALLLGHLLDIPATWLMLLPAFSGLAGAAATLALRRPVIIPLTAIAGAQQVAAAWHAYSEPYGSAPVPDSVAPSELALFLTLAAVGLFIQVATSPTPAAPSPQPART